MPPAVDDTDHLRVMTYNIYYVFARGQQVDDGMAWVAAQSADIVALQELTNITHDRLAELADGWGHEHSVLHKTSGFSVGLTSSMPIETIDRISEGLHHGCLHARVDGIHVFVVHFSPFRWHTREREAGILLERIRPLLAEGADVIVLGDFNAVSATDRAYLAAHPALLEKSRASDEANGHVENLRDGRFDFAVMQQFVDAGLHDAALPQLEASGAPRWTFSTGIWTDEQDEPSASGTRIDYILASPSIARSVIAAGTPQEGAVNRISDHYPVIVDIARPRAK